MLDWLFYVLMNIIRLCNAKLILEKKKKVGTHLKLCKKQKFYSTGKWSIHKLENVQKNATHNIFWDFYFETDHIIMAKELDNVLINKNNVICLLVDVVIYRIIKPGKKLWELIISGRMETLQTTSLLNHLEYLEESSEISRYLVPLRFQ